MDEKNLTLRHKTAIKALEVMEEDIQMRIRTTKVSWALGTWPEDFCREELAALEQAHPFEDVVTDDCAQEWLEKGYVSLRKANIYGNNRFLKSKMEWIQEYSSLKFRLVD